MGLTLPTRGDAGAGAWDDTIDTNYGLEDSHDHGPGKGARINTDAISLDADLTFSSLYAPINLHRITFASIVALSSNNKSLYVDTSDNELYWRSNTGANVKLTAGSALNVAAFTGGIGGDYAAVGAAVAFEDANDRYTFKQQSNLWARMASGEVRILETGSTETVYVGLAAPAALAASHTITLPLAAPGSTSIMQMDSGGAITASNTVANAVTLSTSLAIGTTLGVTGTATVAAVTASGLITANAGVASTTIVASGLITANAGVTAGANQHVTVSGTGAFKHGTKTLSLIGASFVGMSSAFLDLGGSLRVTTLNEDVTAPIPLAIGDRITAIRAFIRDNNSAGASKLTASFRSLTSTGTSATIASSAESAGNATNQTLTISPAATTIAASTFYCVVLRVTTQAGTDDQTIWGCEVDYDRP